MPKALNICTLILDYCKLILHFDHHVATLVIETGEGKKPNKSFYKL